ncbi:BTB/POZ domain-containing protein [Ditylenchus destructor]|nr:BTB/POZ domain-containing protein [Ditylenchus destructor]
MFAMESPYRSIDFDHPRLDPPPIWGQCHCQLLPGYDKPSPLDIRLQRTSLFPNIILKRALPISRIKCVGNQVRPLTSIYGVEKSTAKYSYSAAKKISSLDFCMKRGYGTRDAGWLYENMTDYKDYVILAEAIQVYSEFCNFNEACIQNTLWKVHNYHGPGDDYGPFHYYFSVTLKDILPRNETCHAEILFIDKKNSVTHKFRNKFEFRDRKSSSLRNYIESAAVIRILEEKQKFLKEFENRWAKDVTFLMNGEKITGDRQYLSAISPVFKKLLQDHAQDEITLEGVESADMLQDFFLAISPLRVQPNPDNVVSLLKLAHDFDIPFLMRSCEEHLKHCYEISTKDRYLLAMKHSLNSLHEDIIKNLKEKVRMYDMRDFDNDTHPSKKRVSMEEFESEKKDILKMDEEICLEKKQNIEAETLKEFENRWAKDVTFVVNGEKCAGDRQYLSAISPVFKKMLQDHARDEITLEGVESADVLKDFFLAVFPLRVQPNPTNVVPLLKLAHDYDIPFLMRNCEEYLKQCSEIPAIDRFLLAMKYDLNSLKLHTERRFRADDLIKILGELNALEQKQEVLERVNNNRLAEILTKKTDILSEAGTEFLLRNIAERLRDSYSRKEHKYERFEDDDEDDQD